MSHEIGCNFVKKNVPGASSVVGPCIRAINGDVSCGKLFCEYGTYGYCTSFNFPEPIMVLNGTSCGTGKACLAKSCVTIPELETNNPTVQPTLQPTFKPTKQPNTTKPSRFRRRCVWRNQKRLCRWKRGERPTRKPSI